MLIGFSKVQSSIALLADQKIWKIHLQQCAKLYNAIKKRQETKSTWEGISPLCSKTPSITSYLLKLQFDGFDKVTRYITCSFFTKFHALCNRIHSKLDHYRICVSIDDLKATNVCTRRIIKPSSDQLNCTVNRSYSVVKFCVYLCAYFITNSINSTVFT